MGLGELIFGRSPRSRILRRPPANAKWRRIQPRETPPVRAVVAESDQNIQTSHGVLHASAGDDVLVHQGDGECSVVRRDIFERTYERVEGNLYQKRPDLVLRYFTMPKPVMVETMEGPQRAEAGDWIIEGVAGELWPVAKDKALEKYEQL